MEDVNVIIDHEQRLYIEFSMQTYATCKHLAVRFVEYNKLPNDSSQIWNYDFCILQPA